jgi:eukaryotic-like serine/threonine-protein kinase
VIVAFEGTDRYRIVGELGRGAFGCVYEAHDVEKNRRVALKVLEQIRPDSVYRFKQEFRSLSGIRHRNLVSLYDLETHEDFWLISMELVRGRPFLELADAARTRTMTGTLARRAREGISLGDSRRPATQSFYEIRILFQQLLDGIAALHDAGRLHRDIKPSNILVTEVGRVVLLDFGLVYEPAPGNEEEASEFVGTPGYMSPELVMSEAATAASDWYSYGVLLFQSLTGRLPFRGDDVMQVLMQQTTSEPPRPSTLQPGIPEDLDELCHRLLARNPSERPSADEIRTRLGGDALTYWSPSNRTTHAPGTSRFVGRTRELETLLALESRSREKPLLVFLRGTSGAGKTMLLNRFFDLRRSRGNAVLILSRCYPNDFIGFNAIDGVIDSLARHLEKLPFSEQSRIVPDEVAFLSRLFPVLDRVDAIAARTRLLEEKTGLTRRAAAALREMLRMIAQTSPVIIGIDNAHWGDLDSAEMLVEVLSADDAPPILMILTYTEEDAGTSLFLQRLRAGGVETSEIEVGPMPDGDVTSVVREILGGDESAAMHAILRESGGNPFLATEYARGIRDGLAGSESLALRHVLDGRLATLPEASRRVIEVLAVAGQPLTIDVVAEIADLDAVEVEVFVPLRELRFIRSRFTGYIEEIELYHDFVRRATLETMELTTRRRLHFVIADVLARHQIADLETIEQHRAASGVI